MINYDTRYGKVTLTNNYFSKLIGRAVTHCFGVAGMVPCSGRQKVRGLIFKTVPIDTGVIIRGSYNALQVELHITVSYGMNISAISESIVHRVKYTVKEATGIPVAKVTIVVDGLKN